MGCSCPFCSLLNTLDDHYLWLCILVALSHPSLSHHMASVLPAPGLIPVHSRLCPCSCSFLACIALPEPLLPLEIIPPKILSDATPHRTPEKPYPVLEGRS